MTDADAGAGAGVFTDGGRAVSAGQGWAWIAGGFEMFKRQPGAWILVTIILGVIFILMGLVPFLGPVATLVLYPVFGGGIMLGCRALEHGGELEAGHVFAGFKGPVGNLVLIGVLAIAGWIAIMIPVFLIMGGGAMVGMVTGDMAGAMTMGASAGLALLILLALSIPLYMALWFAPALVALRDMAPVDALKQSFRGCLRNLVPFIVYGIILFPLIIVAVIPFGLGLLILIPVMMASVYVSYRDLYGAS